MKKDVYIPYKFNSKYEYQTYKNIGLEHKIEYKSKKNICYKIYWRIRKLYNRNEKKYKNFKVFSEWEEYIRKETKNRIKNNKKAFKNFLHYLESRKRRYKYDQSLITAIGVPVYMTLMAGALALYNLVDFYNVHCKWFIFVLFLIVVFLILHIFLSNYTRRYYFYSDYIRITKKNKIDFTSHQQ